MTTNTHVYWHETGLDDMIREVTRLTRAPSFRVIRGIERVHNAAFMETQALTHVISGSLKASGTSYTRFENDEWMGTIEYGGALVRPPVPLEGLTPSQAAPKDPVDYAIYEMARGGEHNFFSTLPAFHPLYEQAILEWFRDHES